MNQNTVKAWWGQRPTREKVLLVAAALGVLAAGSDWAVTAPLEKQLRREKAALVELKDRMARAHLAKAGTDGAQGDLRQQEAAWQQRLQAAHDEARDLRQHMGDTAALPETLRAITATVGSLRLLSLDLTAAPDTTAVASATAASGVQANNPLPRLYRLPVALKVSGSFAELHTLLMQFERHAQALRWTQLQLDATQWPAIELTLKAHVLSLTPHWGATS